MEINDLYLTIINNMTDGVYLVNLERRIFFWNKAAETITGYCADEIVGRQCQDNLLNHIDEEGRPLCITGCPLFSAIIDGKQRREHVFVRHKDGYRIPILVNIFPLKKDGEIIGAIEIFSQNSPTIYEDNLVEHLSEIAMHDTLTKLPNRRYLESFLDYKLNEYQRFGRLFAVLFADIDDFSHFNNEYGHDTGDRVLVNIAAGIKKNMNRNDLIGRWGGEEFLGIFSITNGYDASILGGKIPAACFKHRGSPRGSRITCLRFRRDNRCSQRRHGGLPPGTGGSAYVPGEKGREKPGGRGLIKNSIIKTSAHTASRPQI